ncbi:FYVE-type domain-containing protein [Trichostrongylus colubriformis]|uniref:FYVE-type domain-containing protein n=1 Tax=Trichostrongylus colubriformis TaxID=6319 RepID=A0AAN8IK79_TRICO
MWRNVTVRKSVKLLRSAALALRFLRREMPSSVCCSNCYSKYSILNPEITRIAIGDPPASHHSGVTATSSTNWWGDGLPPPSLRTTVGQPQPALPVSHTKKREDVKKAPCVENKNDLESRWKRVREEDDPSKVLTLSEIEERLAALRGCDVELIRRPRCMFESSEKPCLAGKTAEELMKEARDLAEIEEEYDVDKEMERRFKRLKYEDKPEQKDTVDGAETNSLDAGPSNGPRLSTVSSATAFSEATAKELEEINRLMEDAEKRVKASEADNKLVQQEMRSVLAATRQKSFELEKVNREIGKFWNKQLEKVEISESDEDDVDDEVVRKIILEAEQATPDVPEDPPPEKAAAKSASVQPPSPKKGGLFSKIFRR